MSSTQHTEGRLIAIRNQMRDDGQHFLCRDVPPEPYPRGGGAFPGEPPRMQLPPAVCGMGMPEAVARRLAACWNFCEGVETDAVEESPTGLAQLFEGVMIESELITTWRQRAQQAVDVLAKVEQYLMARVDPNGPTHCATVILPMIKAAREGSGVAPTQSRWSDLPGPEATHG